MRAYSMLDHQKRQSHVWGKRECLARGLYPCRRADPMLVETMVQVLHSHSEEAPAGSKAVIVHISLESCHHHQSPFCQQPRNRSDEL